jgi:hypothetical protein
MAMSSPKDIRHNPSKHHCVEAKPRVRFDWLVTSFKWKPYLELCRFIQALLKTKVIRRKVCYLVAISKRPLCIIRQNGCRIIRGAQPERRMLHLEPHCYNKSGPCPKALASPNLDECKSFRVCFKSLLDFS